MKKIIFVFLCFSCFIMEVGACYCANHGEIIGCSINGYLYSDGTISPLVSEILETVEKEEVTIYGCTDSKADNYNPKALKDDKSCTYKKSIAKIKLFNNIETDIILIGIAIMIVIKLYRK